MAKGIISAEPISDEMGAVAETLAEIKLPGTMALAACFALSPPGYAGK